MPPTPGCVYHGPELTLTVLIDLDDTLLENNMDSFIPPYLQLLAASLTDIPAKNIIQGILSATRVMQSNTDPSKTLEQVFDEYFYPQIGYTKHQLSEKINQFYSNEFHKLKCLTSPRDGAFDVVEQIIQRGHQVVIATNPLFPRTAIMQRMEWAGLGPLMDQISLVTTFENFHFSKPNVSYVSEILAQLGWKNQRAVMLGNSLEDDIMPADHFGLPTFFLSNNSQNSNSPQHPLQTSGSFPEIIPWLSKVETNNTPIKTENLYYYYAILQSTPAAIQTILSHSLAANNKKTNLEIKRLLITLINFNNSCLSELIARNLSKNRTFVPDQVIEPDDIDETALLNQFIDMRKKLLNLITDYDNAFSNRNPIESLS